MPDTGAPNPPPPPELAAGQSVPVAQEVGPDLALDEGARPDPAQADAAAEDASPGQDGFDAAWYVGRYPDVADFPGGPAAHYARFGAVEGRWPRADFDPVFYGRHYPDVLASGIDPLRHFLRNGRAEGRLGALPPDPPWAVLQPLAAPRPGGDLQWAEDGAGYVSTGSDPQLLIPVELPAGFFHLRLFLRFAPGAPGSRRGVCQIFVGDAHGLREANSYAFRIDGEEARIDELLFSPLPVRMLRVDPGSGRFTAAVQWVAAGAAGFPEASAEILRRILALDPLEREPLLARLGTVPAATWWQSAVGHVLRAPAAHLGSYERYQVVRRVDAQVRAYLRARAKAWADPPLLSVLMPVFRPDLTLLEAAIASVRDQTYDRWELVIADDGTGSAVLAAALAAAAGADPRIRVLVSPVNQGIAAATNRALAAAGGEFVLLLDQDDLLAPQAMHAIADAIVRHPDADMIYSDEDKIGPDGRRFGPFFKPDWSPEYFLSCMYTCHLGAYRRSLVEEVGRFRSEFDFAQDYDLALRVSERARRVIHVPDVLYHWRIIPGSTAGGAEAKPLAEGVARRALQAALDRRGVAGAVVPAPLPGMHRLRLRAAARQISLVVLTAGRRVPGSAGEPGGPRWLVLDFVASVVQRTTYPGYELLIVHNGDLEPTLQERLAQFGPRFVQYQAEEFNLSEKMNFGVESAAGDLVVLLNDDMLVLEDSWLAEMAQWFDVPGVAGVGAKLLFADGTVQHAGVLLLENGPSHPWYGSDGSEPGLGGGLLVARNYTAVTGACLMVRRADYLEVGGFDPALRINYNDVDFCMRLQARGRIVFTPYARLTHYEAVSKDPSPGEELETFNRRWGAWLGRDPAYNVNLSQVSSTAELASIPRRIEEDY